MFFVKVFKIFFGEEQSKYVLVSIDDDKNLKVFDASEASNSFDPEEITDEEIIKEVKKDCEIKCRLKNNNIQDIFKYLV